MWVLALATADARGETVWATADGLGEAIDRFRARADEPIAVVTANRAQERAVQALAPDSGAVFVRAKDAPDSIAAMTLVGRDCGVFVGRRVQFGAEVDDLWFVIEVGECAGVRFEPVDTRVRRTIRPPPPAHYAEGNAFAFAGIVELGPGAGIGASADLGITWMVHLHAEVGEAVHNPTLSSTEPDGVDALTRLNIEVGYPVPLSPRTMLAPGGAYDLRYLSPSCDEGGCAGAVALGFGFRTEPDSDRTDYVSAFWGLGYFVISDVGAPLMRMRAEWGHENGLYTGFEVSGRYDTTVMVGLHL